MTPAVRRVGLQGDDERQADDRAVDDARHLRGSEMGFDRSSHAWRDLSRQRTALVLPRLEPLLEALEALG